MKCNSNRISSSFHELGVLCKFFFFRTSFHLNFNAFQAHFNIFLYIFFSYLCNIIQGKRRAGLNFIFQKILIEPTMFLSIKFSITLLWHQFTNFPIHKATIFLWKYLFIYCFIWIEIIQLFLNLEGASKCISQHHITPNFVKRIFVDWWK